MKTTINCFLPYADPAQVKATVEGLKESPLVSKIFLLATGSFSSREGIMQQVG